MFTTGQLVRTPRSKAPREFPVRCLTCTGPLMQLRNRLVPVWVHARHRDWLKHPHPAYPITPMGAMGVDGAPSLPPEF